MWESPFWSLTKDFFWVKAYWLPNTTAGTSRLSDFKQIKSIFVNSRWFQIVMAVKLLSSLITNSQLDWMYVKTLDVGAQNTLFSFADTDWQLKIPTFINSEAFSKTPQGWELRWSWFEELRRVGVGEISASEHSGTRSIDVVSPQLTNHQDCPRRTNARLDLLNCRLQH